MKYLIKAGANNGLCTCPYAVDGIIVKRFKLIIIGKGANLLQGVAFPLSRGANLSQGVAFPLSRGANSS